MNLGAVTLLNGTFNMNKHFDEKTKGENTKFSNLNTYITHI